MIFPFSLVSGSGSVSPSQSARLLALRGRALSVSAEPSDEAQDLLSRAVKLDPTLVEAWNALGEYYWKKGSNDVAKNCFTCCLDHVGAAWEFQCVLLMQFCFLVLHRCAFAEISCLFVCV